MESAINKKGLILITVLITKDGNYREVKLIFNTKITKAHILTFKSFWLTGEVTQQLRALALLPKGPNFITSTYMATNSSL